MTNVQRVRKRNDDAPPPTPYAIMQLVRPEAPPKWIVLRNVFTPGAQAPDSYSDAPISLEQEVAGQHDLAYDAIRQCYELNHEPVEIHPLDALAHLYAVATQHHTGGSSVIAAFLLGLYNGMRFKFDLTDLRRLDRLNAECCYCLLKFDHAPVMEIHHWLDNITGRTDFGQRFERLAYDYSIENFDPDAKSMRLEPFRMISPLNP